MLFECDDVSFDGDVKFCLLAVPLGLQAGIRVQREIGISLGGGNNRNRLGVVGRHRLGIYLVFCPFPDDLLVKILYRISLDRQLDLYVYNNAGNGIPFLPFVLNENTITDQAVGGICFSGNGNVGKVDHCIVQFVCAARESHGHMTILLLRFFDIIGERTEACRQILLVEAICLKRFG